MGNPGSVLGVLTPFPADPVDPVDPADQVDPAENSRGLQKRYEIHGK